MAKANRPTAQSLLDKPNEQTNQFVRRGEKRPVTANPLANMGLDDIVRGITSPSPTSPKEEVEETADAPVEATPAKPGKQRRSGIKDLERNLEKYTGISEQGVAIWLPKEVKKRLDIIRINSSRSIPVRALASAIIMTYLDQNEEKLSEL